jgi:hypothetical protein
MNGKDYVSDETYRVSKDNIVTSSPVIRIDLWKAVLIVVTAMLGSAGAGLYGAMATLNSDHFAVVALVEDVKGIKENYMPLNVSNEKWKNNDYQHGEIIRRLDVIQTTLGRLK